MVLLEKEAATLIKMEIDVVVGAAAITAVEPVLLALIMQVVEGRLLSLDIQGAIQYQKIR